MKFKKLTALIMISLLAVSTLAGCGEKVNEESKETSTQQKETENEKEQESESVAVEESNNITFPLDETMEFTMFRVGSDDLEYTYSENPVWISLEEATNVHFEQTEVILAEASQKANLLVGGGDYPDVFFGGIIDPAIYGGPNGVLLPLEDLIREHAPNLTALLDEFEAWDAIRNPEDGEIYYLPQINGPSLYEVQTFLYNQVWLDKLGFDVPQNYDEFYQTLKAIKENDPNGNGEADEIPLLLACDYKFSLFNLSPYFMTDCLVYPTQRVMIVDGEMQFLPTSDKFKELLVEATKWYSEGLINKDCFTLPYSELYGVLDAANNYGYTMSSIGGAGSWVPQYDRFTPVEGSGGLTAVNGVSANGVTITDKCENPEVVVAFMDRLYTDELSLQVLYGVEGEEWEFNEKGRVVKLTDVSKGALTFPGFLSYNHYYASNMKEATTYELTGEYQEAQTAYVQRVGTLVPVVKWEGEYLDTFVDIEAALAPYVTNYVANVVIGEISLEDTWEDFKAEVEKIGVHDYLKAFNTACGEAYTVAE